MPSKEAITRRILERYDIPGSKDELQTILVEYQPGVVGPPHIHPVVGLVYIIEGEAESQYEGEEVKTFRAGDSYQDLANRTHLSFRNTSSTQPLKFIIACQIPKGESFTQNISAFA